MNGAYTGYNNDNIIRAIEDVNDIQGLEDTSGPDDIHRILKNAVAVWVDLDGNGTRHRFEIQLDGSFFEWDTNVIFDKYWFRDKLSNLVFGKDYFVEYA